MKKIIATVLLAALCISVFASCAVYRINGDLRVAVFDNITKVLRDEELPIDADTELTVSLARNESEGMQFVLKSENRDIKVKNVTVSDLTLENGDDTIPASDITVYRQHYMYVDVHYYTYTGYPDAYYPDALIEQKYDLAHYADGLPVAKGDNQGYWLTVKATADRTAGTYTGTVTVETDLKTVDIPVTCTVWDFNVPEESHFKTAFALYGLNDYDGQRVQYYKFIQEYRLSGCYLPVIEEKPSISKTTEDYLNVMSAFDTNINQAVFFNLNYRRSNKQTWTCSECGYSLIADPLSPDFICPDCGADAEKFQCWICRNCRTFYTGLNIPDDYVCPTCYSAVGDKYCDYCGSVFPKSSAPSTDTCPNCGHDELGNMFKRYSQHYFFDDFKNTLSTLYNTTPLQGRIYAITHDEPKYQLGPNWAEDVLQFCGDVNRELPWLTSFITYDDFLPTADSEDGQKVRYLPGAWCIKPNVYAEGDAEDFHAHGQELWFYTCNWPTYPAINTHIDSYLAAARLLEWIEYDYDIDGYFCFSATTASRATNAAHPDDNEWVNPYNYLKSDDPNDTSHSDPAGDGYVIIIGREGDGIIDDNVPVPTIRLEAIRDGMEDYEYLWLFEQKINSLIDEYGLDIEADDVLQMFFSGLFKDTSDWTLDTDKILYTREKLAEFIAADDDFICYLTTNACDGVINVFTDGTQTVKVNGKEVSGENGKYTVEVPVDETLYINEYTVTVGDSERTLFVFPDRLHAITNLIEIDGNEQTIVDANTKAEVTVEDGKITAELTADSYYLLLPLSVVNTDVDLSNYTHLRLKISQDGAEMTDEFMLMFKSSFSTNSLTVEQTESGTYVDILLTASFKNSAMRKLKTIWLALPTPKTVTVTVSDIQLINKDHQDPQLKANAGIK